MARDNPYEAPKADSNAPIELTPVIYWRLPFLFASAVVASVPFYGFFVHAARDSQDIAVVIMLCWFLTWVFAISSIVLAVVRPPRSKAIRKATVIFNVYLFIAGIVGYIGVGHAVSELLAG